ncbi:MAG: riboflavin kinase, partial [Verrucomicrobiales bacterium]
LGYRPSIEGGPTRRLLEVHLLNWEGDLYGQDLEIRFLEFLRPELRFEDLETLKGQIADDASLARRIADEEGLPSAR